MSKDETSLTTIATTTVTATTSTATSKPKSFGQNLLVNTSTKKPSSSSNSGDFGESSNSVANKDKHIYTNIALGNCIQNLMNTHSVNKNNDENNNNSITTPTNSNSKSFHHKNLQNIKEESRMIPVPSKKKNTISDDKYLNYHSGRSSPSTIYSGSPGSPPVSSISMGSRGVSRAASPLPGNASGGENRLEIVKKNIFLSFFIFFYCLFYIF